MGRLNWICGVQRTFAMRTSIDNIKTARRSDLLGAWDDACEREWLDIVAALQSAVDGPLAYPDFTRPFRIAVDAAMLPGGVGVCLEQVQADGRIRPIGYASRALTRTQLRWDTSRPEAWALVFGLRTFR